MNAEESQYFSREISCGLWETGWHEGMNTFRWKSLNQSVSHPNFRKFHLFPKNQCVTYPAGEVMHLGHSVRGLLILSEKANIL